jgi:hypothetical protein
MRQSGRSGSEMGRRGSQLRNRLQVGKQFFFLVETFQVTEIMHIVVNSVDNLLDSFFRLLLRRVLFADLTYLVHFF